MYLVKLDPPIGLIPLVDPVGKILGYGGQLITKDLFFSGHTASLLILFLAVKIRWLKIFFLVVLLTMIMLLWQHVHYTVDILGAFVFYDCGMADYHSKICRTLKNLRLPIVKAQVFKFGFYNRIKDVSFIVGYLIWIQYYVW